MTIAHTTIPARLLLLAAVLASRASAAGAAKASAAETLARYLKLACGQPPAPPSGQTEIAIDARVPRLARQGSIRALRRVSSDGEVTYETLDASGDSTVRREIIGRYLAGQNEARALDTITVNPFNYRFRFRGARERRGRRVEVFQLTPRAKKVGLFKGELWLDEETGLPVRESGQFVRSPSIFVRRISFVRDFEIHGGMALPVHISGVVDTRLFGRAEVEIEFNSPGRENGAQLEQES